MHEMSLAQSILDIIFEEAKAHNLSRISGVNLVVGEISAVVPESLRFCFSILTEETIAAGAEMKLETVPTRAQCTECMSQFEVEDNRFVCPECQGPGMILKGQELYIASIEGE